MKRALVFLIAFGAQIATVLLLARIVRVRWWWEHFNAHFSEAFVFGLAAFLAFVGYLRYGFKPPFSTKRLVASILASLLLTILGYVASEMILLATDKLLSKRYVSQMRPRLHSDPRYAHIRMMDMSCDSDWGVLFPFLHLSGSVASEEDRRVLLHFLNEAHPPAHVDAVVIEIGNVPPSNQEFLRRLREDE